MIAYAKARVSQGLIMPGLIVVPQRGPVGPIIDDLLLLTVCSDQEEWQNQIIFLPFPS